MIYISKMVAI